MLDLIPWTKAIGLVRKADKFISAVTRVGRQLLKWRDDTKWADRVLAGASCPVPNSFVSGTRVVMAGGGSKPIEDLEVGEEVLATDPETGETAVKRVEAVITGDGDKDLVEVSVATGGGGRSVITATDGHPFWVPELSEWVDAADLAVGQWLQTSAGTWVQITAVEHRSEATRVHNLTIADIHTYYVVAGTTPVLVHNCGGDIYEAGGKHGATARSTSRGMNSAEPANGQAALENSVQVKGTSPRRVGVDRDSGEIVVLDRTRQAACGCDGAGGVNNIWHGHVRPWGDLHVDMQNALRRGGLVDRKGNIR